VALHAYKGRGTLTIGSVALEVAAEISLVVSAQVG